MEKVQEILQIQEKAYFNIDNSDFYEGYHIKNQRWNGWARPYFEKRVADIFVNKFSASDYQIVYDKYTDCFICKILEDNRVVDLDTAEKMIINTKEGKKEVYDFGSVGWIWDDYTLDEIKNMDDITIVTPDKIIKNESINMEY